VVSDDGDGRGCGVVVLDYWCTSLKSAVRCGFCYERGNVCVAFRDDLIKTQTVGALIFSSDVACDVVNRLCVYVEKFFARSMNF
jgi:hypothetical protein